MNEKNKYSNIPRFIVAGVLFIAIVVMWINNKNKAEELKAQQNSITIKADK